MKVVNYPCVNCGADLIFRAEKQDFHCRHCDSDFTSEQIAEIYPENEYHPLDVEEEPVDTQEAENFAAHNALYNCPNCGADIVTDDTTSATRCFYCHSPVILTGRLSGDYKPSKLIPFKVTEQEAKQKFKEFCKKRLFIPKGFKTDAVLEQMQAIYIPYWIATCSTGGRITANGKIIRIWRQGNYQYTETNVYAVIREGGMIFEKIPADASKKANDVLMETIEPFNYKELADFRMSYLSGYLAEKYDVTKDSVYPRIRERARSTAEALLKSTIHGYNSVTVTNSTVDVQKTIWEHYLLPVWFLSYRYKDEMYYYAINGQTGKWGGNLPVVWGKVIAACGITSLLITVLFLLGGAFL